MKKKEQKKASKQPRVAEKSHYGTLDYSSTLNLKKKKSMVFSLKHWFYIILFDIIATVLYMCNINDLFMCIVIIFSPFGYPKESVTYKSILARCISAFNY